uniref:Uncharacterized protein n=1 Tax=Anguilla anguilla TaxID=7936 RepID=A0A0E9XZ33_ANGAN
MLFNQKQCHEKAFALFQISFIIFVTLICHSVSDIYSKCNIRRRHFG